MFSRAEPSRAKLKEGRKAKKKKCTKTDGQRKMNGSTVVRKLQSHPCQNRNRTEEVLAHSSVTNYSILTEILKRNKYAHLFNKKLHRKFLSQEHLDNQEIPDNFSAHQQFAPLQARLILLPWMCGILFETIRRKPKSRSKEGKLVEAADDTAPKQSKSHLPELTMVQVYWKFKELLNY